MAKIGMAPCRTGKRWRAKDVVENRKWTVLSMALIRQASASCWIGNLSFDDYIAFGSTEQTKWCNVMCSCCSCKVDIRWWVRPAILTTWIVDARALGALIMWSKFFACQFILLVNCSAVRVNFRPVHLAWKQILSHSQHAP